jgi:hypothetical protein
MKSHERKHDRDAGCKIDPQANAHPSLQPRDHTAAEGAPEGSGRAITLM